MSRQQCPGTARHESRISKHASNLGTAGMRRSRSDLTRGRACRCMVHQLHKRITTCCCHIPERTSPPWTRLGAPGIVMVPHCSEEGVVLRVWYREYFRFLTASRLLGGSRLGTFCNSHAAWSVSAWEPRAEGPRSIVTRADHGTVYLVRKTQLERHPGSRLHYTGCAEQGVWSNIRLW
jgi:hypothetical protein